MILSPRWTMDALAAAIAARSLRRPCSVRPSTEPRSSSIPALGTDASLLYASASSAGCSDAAKPAGSPLRKTWCDRIAIGSRPLLPRGEGGRRSRTDEGLASTNPRRQPFSRRRGEARIGPRVFLAYVSGPSGGRSGAPSLLPQGEGGRRSRPDEGVAPRKGTLTPRPLSRWRGEARLRQRP